MSYFASSATICGRLASQEQRCKRFRAQNTVVCCHMAVRSNIPRNIKKKKHTYTYIFVPLPVTHPNLTITIAHRSVQTSFYLRRLAGVRARDHVYHCYSTVNANCNSFMYYCRMRRQRKKKHVIIARFPNSSLACSVVYFVCCSTYPRPQKPSLNEPIICTRSAP